MNDTQTAQEKLAEVIAALATELGPEWRVKTPEDGGVWPNRYRIERAADGAMLIATLTTYPSKLALFGVWPTGPNCNYRSARDYGLVDADASASLSRPVAAIVADLTRRAVTPFLVNYALALAARAEETAAIDAQEALAARLAALLNVTITPRDARWQSDKTPSFRKYARPGEASSVERVEVQVRDGVSVDITLSAVPADFAEKVLQLLRPRYLEEKSQQGD